MINETNTYVHQCKQNVSTKEQIYAFFEVLIMGFHEVSDGIRTYYFCDHNLRVNSVANIMRLKRF